jgi:hypothetical protein
MRTQFVLRSLKENRSEGLCVKGGGIILNGFYVSRVAGCASSREGLRFMEFVSCVPRCPKCSLPCKFSN